MMSSESSSDPSADSDQDQLPESGEKLKKFVVVEERGNVLSLIYREWLIKGEKYYWHPGAESDKLHLDLCRELVPARIHGPLELDGGQLKIKMNWRKVEYIQIHFSHDDLRRANLIMKTLSDAEGKTKNDKRKNKRKGGSKAIKRQADDRGDIVSSKSSRETASALKRDLQKSWPVFHQGCKEPMPQGSEEPVHHGGNSGSNIIIDHGGNGSDHDADGIFSSQQHIIGASAPLSSKEKADSIRVCMKSPSLLPLNPQHQENILRAIAALEAKFDGYSAMMTRIESNQALLISHAERNERRLDRLLSTMKNNSSSMYDIGDITSLLPIRTEVALLSFDEKLVMDDIFRDKFCEYLKHVQSLNKNNPKKDEAVIVMLENIFDIAKLTDIGNWSGVRIVKDGIAGTTKREKVISFRDKEVFKMVLNKAIELVQNSVEATKVVQEWIRNSRGTKLRYHAEDDGAYERRARIRRRQKKLKNPPQSLNKSPPDGSENDAQHSVLSMQVNIPVLRTPTRTSTLSTLSSVSPTLPAASTGPLTRSQTKNAQSNTRTIVVPYNNY